MRNLAKEKVKFLSKLQLRLCWPATPTRLACHASPRIPYPCLPSVLLWLLVLACALSHPFAFVRLWRRLCGAGDGAISRLKRLGRCQRISRSTTVAGGCCCCCCSAVAVAVAVAAATFHQCQLGIKLQTFTYGNFNWPLDEKSPMRRCLHFVESLDFHFPYRNAMLNGFCFAMLSLLLSLYCC